MLLFVMNEISQLVHTFGVKKGSLSLEKILQHSQVLGSEAKDDQHSRLFLKIS